MKCKRCSTKMVIGQAIKPESESGTLTIAQVAPLTSKTLELIEVLKCPGCGHSESISTQGNLRKFGTYT